MLNKIDATVKRETLYIAKFVVLLSVLMQAVFLVIGRWDGTVLLGNVLGGAAAAGNFFLMGLSIQKSLDKDPKDAKNYMKFSHSMRFLMLLLIAVIAYLLPVFNIIAVLIPYLFPRIAIAFRPVFDRERGEDTDVE